MTLGVVMALLWWPGLVRSFTTPQRWVAVAWVVMAVLYLDAAVDSPLDLSVLYYRGQDRLAMPLAMLSVLLTVPGLQMLVGAVRSSRRSSRPLVVALVCLALIAAGLLAARPPRQCDEEPRSLPGRPRPLPAA